MRKSQGSFLSQDPTYRRCWGRPSQCICGFKCNVRPWGLHYYLCRCCGHHQHPHFFHSNTRQNLMDWMDRPWWYYVVRHHPCNCCKRSRPPQCSSCHRRLVSRYRPCRQAHLCCCYWCPIHHHFLLRRCSQLLQYRC